MYTQTYFGIVIDTHLYRYSTVLGMIKNNDLVNISSGKDTYTQTIYM